MDVDPVRVDANDQRRRPGFPPQALQLDELDAYRIAGLERAEDGAKGQLPAAVGRNLAEPSQPAAARPTSA